MSASFISSRHSPLLLFGVSTSRPSCWMSIEGGMVYSFIVPVSLLIMVMHGAQTTNFAAASNSRARLHDSKD